jgi:PAS domain S-box-containing protein
VDLTLLESVPDAVVVVLPAGTIVYVNARAEATFGYSRADLVGRQVEILVPAPISSAHERHREDYLAAPRARPMGSGLELEAVRKDDSRVAVEISLSPVDIDGKSHIIAFVRDITERQRLRRQAEESARQRDEALAIAAHELRTPISVQSLAIDMLQRVAQRPGSGPTVAKLISRMKTSSERVGKLVDELTELTTLRRGKLELRIEEFDLASSVENLVDELRPELERSGTELGLDTEPTVGRWDRLRLEQVVTNLLTNAMRHGEGKPIRVSVSGDATRARVVVEDRGPGIAREDQERVFEQFERALGARRSSGLGLGLYIARRIVEAHGGGLLLRSAPGAGAAFTVELPRMVPPERLA